MQWVFLRLTCSVLRGLHDTFALPFTREEMEPEAGCLVVLGLHLNPSGPGPPRAYPFRLTGWPGIHACVRWGFPLFLHFSI